MIIEIYWNILKIVRTVENNSIRKKSMIKRVILLSFALLPLWVYAQTKEISENDILNLRSCYEKFKSHDLQEKSIEVDGEVYNLMSERDFARENIMVCDKDELQKISDEISIERFGVKGRFGYIVDWKSMRQLFDKEFTGEMQLRQAAMSYSQDGSFQLMCHGISDQSHNSLNKIYLDGKVLDADKAAKLILEEMEGYDIITKYTRRPLVVVIHACGVGGKSSDSFASQLSGYLAEKSSIIYVVAASGNVHPVVSWPYKEVVMENGKMINWNCFHGGKFLKEGEKDFETTVIKIQKEYSR